MDAREPETRTSQPGAAMTESRQDYLQYFNSIMLLVLVLHSYAVI
jgi:hypothetical protein